MTDATLCHAEVNAATKEGVAAGEGLLQSRRRGVCVLPSRVQGAVKLQELADAPAPAARVPEPPDAETVRELRRPAV